MEACLVADQAPSCEEPQRILDNPPPGRNYFQELERFHLDLHPRQRAPHNRKERRDAGLSRSDAKRDEGAEGLRSEAAFGRKRAAAVSAAVAVSPGKRARMMAGGPWLQPGAGWVAFAFPPNPFAFPKASPSLPLKFHLFPPCPPLS